MRGSSRFSLYPGMLKTCLNHFFALLAFVGRYNQGLSKIPTALKIRIKNNMVLRRCPERVLAGLTHPLNDLQLHTCSLQQAWIKPKPNQRIGEKMPHSSNMDGIQIKWLFHILLWQNFEVWEYQSYSNDAGKQVLSADECVNQKGHFGSIKNVHCLWVSNSFFFYIYHQETFIHILKNVHCTICGIKKLEIAEM